MLCPYCKLPSTRVVDKRSTEENKAIRRRRECIKCGKRFTTYERADINLIIIKKSGKKEKFDRNKLKIGIMRACEKRPISLKTIERLVNDIEIEIKKLHMIEIKSIIIGNLVMEKLKSLDAVAYVRFASYYKHFGDVKTFKEALK